MNKEIKPILPACDINDFGCGRATPQDEIEYLLCNVDVLFQNDALLFENDQYLLSLIEILQVDINEILIKFDDYVLITDFDNSQDDQDLVIQGLQTQVDNLINSIINAPKLAAMELRNATGGTVTTTFSTLLTNASISIPSTDSNILDFDTTNKNFVIKSTGMFTINFTASVSFSGANRTLILRLVDNTGSPISAEYSYNINSQTTGVSGVIGVRINDASILPYSIRLQGRDTAGTTLFSNVVYNCFIVEFGGSAGTPQTTNDIQNVSSVLGSTATDAFNTIRNQVQKFNSFGSGTNLELLGQTQVQELVPQGTNTAISISGNVVMSSNGKITIPSGSGGIANNAATQNDVNNTIKQDRDVILWQGLAVGAQTATLSQTIDNFKYVLIYFTGEKNYLSKVDTTLLKTSDISIGGNTTYTKILGSGGQTSNLAAFIYGFTSKTVINVSTANGTSAMYKVVGIERKSTTLRKVKK